MYTHISLSSPTSELASRMKGRASSTGGGGPGDMDFGKLCQNYTLYNMSIAIVKKCYKLLFKAEK